MRPAFHAELIRLTTVRGLWLGALLATLALPLLSLLVASTGGTGTGDTITSVAATGTIVGLLGFGSWAAAYAASDHAHGSIAVSLALVPRRRTLVAARMGVVAAIAGVAGLVGALVSVVVVAAASPARGHHLGHPAALLAIAPTYAVVAAVGAGVGLALGDSTPAIVVVAVALLAPKPAGQLLGGLQRWVVGASPSTVVTQFVGGAQLPSDQRFPGGEWAALAAMAVAAIAVVTVTGAAFLRRDA